MDTNTSLRWNAFEATRYLESNETTMALMMGPEYHRVARIVILAVMILLSLTANSFACYCLLKQHRKSKGQFLFLNLFIADLAVTCFTMTSQLIWEVMGRRWIAGDIFCRIFKVLQTFGLVGSTYLLVAIAINRYYALVKPLVQGPQPWKLALAAWLASLIPSLPNMYIFRVISASDNITYCTSMFYEDQDVFSRQLYMVFVFSSIFILPFIALVILYTRIIYNLSRRTVVPLSRTFSSIPRAKIKTLKIALAIFSAFAVTNVPYVIQELILAFGNPEVLNRNVVTLFGVISASNSAINPVIYLTFHSKWSCSGSNCCGRVKETWMRTFSSSDIPQKPDTVTTTPCLKRTFAVNRITMGVSESMRLSDS